MTRYEYLIEKSEGFEKIAVEAFEYNDALSSLAKELADKYKARAEKLTLKEAIKQHN